MTGQRQRLLALWAPVLIYMAGIFLVSSLENPPAPEGVSDVNLHGAVYFGLMLLIVRAVAHGTWTRVTTGAVLAAWIATVLYGASDEWHQMHVAGRHAEWRDLRADALGAFVAGAGARVWAHLRRSAAAADKPDSGSWPADSRTADSGPRTADTEWKP